MSLRFYEIIEANHRIQNPFTDEKLDRLGERLNLQHGMNQLDLACGKGEMLARWSARYGIHGLGVDISDVFLKAAQRRADELGATDRLQFVNSDAATYKAKPAAYDMVSCIGATWIGDGTLGTLELMKPALKPGGTLLVGDIWWIEDPSDAACEAIGLTRDYLTDLGGMPDRFAEAGLILVDMIAAAREDFDEYESLHWRTAYHWLRDNPDDPQHAEFAAWVESNKRSYLRYERRYVGWGVFVLKVKE